MYLLAASTLARIPLLIFDQRFGAASREFGLRSQE
jgi:hypothetical protein